MLTSLARRFVLVVGACSLVAMTLGGCAGTPAKEEPKAAIPASFAFWPLFPADPRVQFARSLASSNDLVPKKHSQFEQVVFGKELERAAEINKPYGVAMRDGKVYVCDMRGKAVFIFDLKKKQTRVMGATGAHPLAHPVAVCAADNGSVLVADNQIGAIFVYDQSEKYVRPMGFPKFKPIAVAAHGDRVYACDSGSQLVQVFDLSSGKHVGTIGEVGDEDGQFRLPVGIACDPSGNVVVIDMMRCRLQKFTPEGKLIVAWGEMGDQGGTFARPKHIAVDREGIAYVVDAAFQNVQMFDAQNRVLMYFGSAGGHPGAMNQPVGICVSEDGLEYVKDLMHPGFEPKRLVLVTNQFGEAKVSIYAMGELKKGFSAQDLAAAAATVNPGVGGTPQDIRDFQTQAGQNVEGDQPEGEQPSERPTEPPTGNPTKPEPPKEAPK